VRGAYDWPDASSNTVSHLNVNHQSDIRNTLTNILFVWLQGQMIEEVIWVLPPVGRGRPPNSEFRISCFAFLSLEPYRRAVKVCLTGIVSSTWHRAVVWGEA
jgi:hypothetical protein